MFPRANFHDFLLSIPHYELNDSVSGKFWNTYQAVFVQERKELFG